MRHHGVAWRRCDSDHVLSGQVAMRVGGYIATFTQPLATALFGSRLESTQVGGFYLLSKSITEIPRFPNPVGTDGRVRSDRWRAPPRGTSVRT